MSLYLKDDVILKVENGKPVLRRKGGPVHILHPVSALTLALLHETESEEEVAEAISFILDLSRERGKDIVETVKYRYKPFLTEERPMVNRYIDPSDFILPPSPPPGRFSAPVGMNWIVTRYCNRRCIYCSAGARWGESAADASLRLERFKEIIDEAVDIGVRNFLFTGGEPFLRPDINGAIKYAVEKGLEVIISTKAFLSRRQIESLKGVKLIQVSLDSPAPETADKLTGSPGFYEEVISTLKALIEAELPVQIAGVLTSINHRHLDGLIKLAHQLGIRRVLLTRYVRTLGRHDPNLFITDEEWEWAYERAMEAAERRDLEVIMDPQEGVNEGFSTMIGEKLAKGDILCAVGRRVLSFRWDGKVPWCEQLSSAKEMITGDLSVQGIIEVWKSERLLSLVFPAIERYKGTPCYGCPNFDSCLLKSGCYFSSILAYGSPFKPPPFYARLCPRYEGRDNYIPFWHRPAS